MKHEWILKEELASANLKTPIYFWKITAIGPCSTDKLEDAARFGSKQEAMMCPAYVHPLSFYEPQEVDTSDTGERDVTPERSGDL